MSRSDLALFVFVGVTALLALLVALRPALTRAQGGKVLAFLALCVLPVIAVWTGYTQQMDRAETTRFCLSCHVMNDFGRSLFVDDRGYIPAVHFQNNAVPRDHACFTCHTDYAMFGGVRSKIRGVRHLYVQYLGVIPPPDRIRLYEPYNNRECLHCHAGARRFAEASAHSRTPATLADITAGHLSCLSSNCHDTAHDVATLKDASFWKGAGF